MVDQAKHEDAGADQEDAPEAEQASQVFDEKDVANIEESARLRAPLIYEIVRREGEEEMNRPFMSLWWSGVAAGLSISFSLLSEAILQTHLPDQPWRPLVAGFGYCVGFLIVVLGRQQLFTENTITAVLPLTAKPSLNGLGRLLRLWLIVFFANMAGTFAAALFCTFTPLPPDVVGGMIEISQHMMQNSWSEMFFRGISSGFLIASMVWLIPNAQGSAQFLVIVLMTYLISIGSFTHIVAGSVEAFLLVLDGQIGLGAMIADFTVPVLLGNIIGGTVLFALISYAQVAAEV